MIYQLNILPACITLDVEYPQGELPTLGSYVFVGFERYRVHTVSHVIEGSKQVKVVVHAS